MSKMIDDYMNSIEGTYPNLYMHKQYCCGCSACYAVCPVNAITMVEDNEGFLYPQMDHQICINCNRCVAVCEFKKDQIIKGFVTEQGVIKQR